MCVFVGGCLRTLSLQSLTKQVFWNNDLSILKLRDESKGNTVGHSLMCWLLTIPDKVLIHQDARTAFFLVFFPTPEENQVSRFYVMQR